MCDFFLEKAFTHALPHSILTYFDNNETKVNEGHLLLILIQQPSVTVLYCMTIRRDKNSTKIFQFELNKNNYTAKRNVCVNCASNLIIRYSRFQKKITVEPNVTVYKNNYQII